jgi:hypothetical protein
VRIQAARNDLVGQCLVALCLIGQWCLHGTLRLLDKRFIGGREDRDGSVGLKCIDAACGPGCRKKAQGRAPNVLGKTRRIRLSC